MAATKILVSGDVKGRFAQLFARVATVNATHGPFECVFCVGDFLGPGSELESALAPYRSGEATPPLKTYFLGPASNTAAAATVSELQAGDEVAPGMVYLGTAGVTTIHGLEVAFVSGVDGGEISQLPADGVAALLAKKNDPSFRGCDVMLTHQWPRGFFRQLPEGSLPVDLLPDSDLPEVGSEIVAELACSLRPRYHFCGSEGQFWQRPAFRQGAGCAHVCRLVALGAVQADKKQKWLHALSLVPIQAMSYSMLTQAPADTTACPYPYVTLAPPAASSDALTGRKRQRQEHVKDERSWITQSCWFCLASPNFETYLVAGVGEEVYACLAKGPLVPNHALVIPIAHRACSLELTADERVEVGKYVDVLRRGFAARGQVAICFERFMCNSQFEHMHLQVVPLPPHLANGAAAAFKTHGERIGIQFELLPPGVELISKLPSPEPFFRVELPDGSQLLHRMATNQRKHPLQFGRQERPSFLVVAAMLGKPERADWKLCLPKAQEGRSVRDLEETLAQDLKALVAESEPPSTE
ncbi:hypothetical protein AB1Y20_018549 [Prymnesium parvum]|uniref:Cwf19-like C-terminal domain-containing protein n=1 Tax=Prymnesium parvum TaxID=97485 RepID=A0AB34JS64_PRYPA